MNKEGFIATTKSLDLINTNNLSMMVILEAMTIFLNDSNGMYMALIDGNHLSQLFDTMDHHIKVVGGKLFMYSLTN